MAGFRWGVSARIMTGILILSLLAVLGGTAGVYAMLGFRSGFQQTAQKDLPTMLQAARLREQSDAMLADVAELVLARSQFSREATSFRIHDRLKAMRDLIGALERSGIEPGMATALRTLAGRLDASLTTLDALLERRIDARRSTADAFTRLRTLRSRGEMVGEGLVAGLDRNREGAMTSNGEYVFWERAEPNAEDSAHLREYARIVEAWRDAFREAAGPLATMAVADDAKTLDALERQFAASMERLQRGTGQLPIEVSARLGPLVEELDSVATGGHGLVPAARSRLNTAARLAGVLAESRYFADRMAARVKSLVDSIGQGVAQRSQGFERQVERGIAAALVMALAFTIAALGVAFYVNGNVLRRLRRLRESMDDYLESGRPRIPAEGDDEIGDIARAFRYFVGEIGSREERLRRLAATDVLTGASNRRHFLEQSLRELQRAKRYGLDLCLVMLDLDRFKEINDRYGHANGDEALKAFVHACRGVLREVDLLGRLGGEEFAVLLPETGAAGAREVAERLRERVMRLGIPSGRRILRFTVSAGITVLRAEDESVDALLHRADAALYEAKRSGRNRVVLGRMAPLHLSPVETSNATPDSGSDPS